MVSPPSPPPRVCGVANRSDHAATMTMPPTLSAATNDDLLFGVAPPPVEPGAGAARVEAKAEDMDDKDASEQGGVVKANKGMILRKSVEYIR